MTDTDNKKMVSQMQRYTASTIGVLDILRTACEKTDETNLSKSELRTMTRFMEASEKFIDSLKKQTEDLNYTRPIKKAFNTLKEGNACELLKNKDSELFNLRDKNNRIITLMPGMDLRFGYKFLEEDEKKHFWQLIYLFCYSVFNMIRLTNSEKITKYPMILEMTEFLEKELGKTGVMFNRQIFNPFIGIDGNKTEFGVNELFTGGVLPNKQSVSIESVLNMLGVDKLFDEKQLNDQLKNIGDEQINEATSKITDMLGAANNPDIKEVCNTLIQDIVLNLKENGISNIGDTLMNVAKNARGKIEMDKMKKTAASVRSFMQNGKEKMKDMKDAEGNPIGEQLINSLAVPMSMLNRMNIQTNDTDNKNQNQ